MAGMEFSHGCLVYAMPWHVCVVTIAIDFPARRCHRGAAEPQFSKSAHRRFGHWHSGAFRISITWMEMRPRRRQRCAGSNKGCCPFLFAGSDFSVALARFPSAQAPPMAEARDDTRGRSHPNKASANRNRGGQRSVCSSNYNVVQNDAMWMPNS